MLSCFSRLWFFGTLWIVACQVPLSMRFSRQEYWSDLPCPPSRGSSRPRDWTCTSCIAANSLPLSHWGSLLIYICVCLQCGRSPGEGATHSSRPGKFHGLYSPWGPQRVRHNWVTLTSLRVQRSSKCVDIWRIYVEYNGILFIYLFFTILLTFLHIWNYVKIKINQTDEIQKKIC